MSRLLSFVFSTFAMVVLSGCLDETTMNSTGGSQTPPQNTTSSSVSQFRGSYVTGCPSSAVLLYVCRTPRFEISENGVVIERRFLKPDGTADDQTRYRIKSISGNVAFLEVISGPLRTKRISIGQERGAVVLRSSRNLSEPLTRSAFVAQSDGLRGFYTQTTGTAPNLRDVVLRPGESASQADFSAEIARRERLEASQQASSSQIGGPQVSCLEFVTTHSNSGHSAYKNICGFVIHCDPTGPNNITTLQPSSGDNIGLFLQAGQRAQCFRGPADPAGRDRGK